MRFSSTRFCVAVAIALFDVTLAAGKTVNIERGIDFQVPPGWSVLPPSFGKIVEIAAVPERQQKSAAAQSALHAVITVEHRKDQSRAIRRLKEIEWEWAGSYEYTTVQSWPALIRRYNYPIPRPGREAAGGRLIAPSVTIAVAYAERVVRLEARLAPGTDRSRLESLTRLGSRFRFASKQSRDSARDQLNELRTRVDRVVNKPPSAETAVEMERDRTAPGVPSRLLAGGSSAELEIAVSSDGQNVVIASLGGFSFSNDGGATFVDQLQRLNDPSVTWGPTGTFYLSTLSQSPCSIGIAGARAPFPQTLSTPASTAVTCPFNNAACSPDQPHVAADRVNRTPGGGDQIYAAWQHFSFRNAASCTFPKDSLVTPVINCSRDSAGSWGAPVDASADTATSSGQGGLFPRIAVGPDGFVYVVYQAGSNIMLNKFTPCSDAAPLTPLGDPFPTVVATSDRLACPIPGLDRCEDGNTLASPMVSIDPSDPDHVYLAMAVPDSATNEDITVFESRDGGLSWPRSIVINSPVPARRFMPWVCSTREQAFVGWYDRRSAIARTDLTEYFIGSVFLGPGGNLFRGRDWAVSIAPDPQCAIPLTCGARAEDDFTSCAAFGPTGGRFCLNVGEIVPTTTPCATDGDCQQAGLVAYCKPLVTSTGGCPKYGDYNGIACTDDAVFLAWASATPSPPAGPAINIFTERINVQPLRWEICQPRARCSDVEIAQGVLSLGCDRPDCVLVLDFGKACSRLWQCSACVPGYGCPFNHSIVFEGLEAGHWNVAPFDANGRALPHNLERKGSRAILTFRPDDKRLGSDPSAAFVLTFTLGPSGVPGKRYLIKAQLEQKE